MHTEQPRLTGVLDAALRQFQARESDPLTAFANLRTGGRIVTRDTVIYRRIPEWQERPCDRQSPVPRRAA